MNTIFKIIWNYSTGMAVVVSELTKSRGKPSSKVNDRQIPHKKSTISLLLAVVLGTAVIPLSTQASVTISNTAAQEGATATDGSIAIGTGTSATGNYTIALGTNSTAVANGSIAIGESANSSNESTIAIGNNSVALAIKSVSIGANATTRSPDSVTLGNNVLTGQDSGASGKVSIGSNIDNTGFQNNSIVIGNSAKSLYESEDNVVIGSHAFVNGNNHVTVLGACTTMASGGNSAQGATLLGYHSSSNQKNSVALGSYSNANKTEVNVTNATVNGIAYSGFCGTTPMGVVAVGANATAARQITYVAAGCITANSIDAINGSQLYAVAKQIALNSSIVKKGINTEISSSVNSTTGGTDYTVNAYNTTISGGSSEVNVTSKVDGYNISYTVDLSDAAKENITTANTTANTANETANTANTTANTANITANTANTTANTANATANTANNTANIANATVNKGWNITTTKSGTGNVEGSKLTNIHMGDTVTLDAGNNIIISGSGKTLNIATSMSPSFNTVTTKELIASGNVTIGGGNGTAVSIANGTTVDMGNNVIHNVGPGKKGTDAVNFNQLNQSIHNVNKNVVHLKKENRRGIATAGALAMIPQATHPGKSMVSASTAYYRGESSLAVGYSSLSNNGKIILKGGVSTSVDSSKDTIIGGAIGYQW